MDDHDAPRALRYDDYLSLGTLLSAQHPKSPEHDEMLFIIQHQASELWMKLMLHELQAVCHHLRRDQLPPALKGMARVMVIMHQLVRAWDVLATMTPSEFAALRPYLGNASGFQSHQYRAIEFMLGNKNSSHLQLHRHHPDLYAQLEAALAAPSLYDEAVLLMARAGLPVAAERLAQDWRQATRSDPSVKAAWLEVYRHTEQYWPLYDMAEKLVDLAAVFRLWRFRHVATVERMIGFKPGTGGTEGVGYLRRMLEVELFPELFELRTEWSSS